MIKRIGVLFFILLIGIASKAQQLESLSVPIDSVIAQGETFVGKPYRYKLSKSVTLDCSGLIQYLFANYNCALPRSANEISSLTKHIGLDDVHKGDLLFFKARNCRSKHVGHVSMVVDTTGGEITMLHSSSHGIKMESYQKTYYLKHFLFAGRLPILFRPEETMDNLIPLGIGKVEEQLSKLIADQINL